jgi:hypothetical protein
MALDFRQDRDPKQVQFFLAGVEHKLFPDAWSSSGIFRVLLELGHQMANQFTRSVR